MGIFKQDGGLKQVISFDDPELQRDLESGNKPYLILTRTPGEYEDHQDDYQEFQAIAMRGRRTVFDYFKNQLGNDDLLHSYVFSGKIPLGQELTLYTFLRLCIEQFFPGNAELTVSELDIIAYETSGIDPGFDLEAFYLAEINKRTKS